jgi:uroporphyrin-3 C-methyltransferase
MTDQKEASERPDSMDEATTEDETVDTDPSTDPENGTQEAGDASASGSRQGVAWIGILLALVALGGVGWLAWQQVAERESDPSEARIEQIAEEVRAQADTLQTQSGQGEAQGERLDGLAGDLAELRSRLEEAAGQSGVGPEALEPLRESIEAQERTTETLSNDLEALVERVDTALERIDRQMSSLQSRRDDRVNESLARAEYRLALVEMAGLLRVAHTAARASDDPVPAVDAYERALSRARGLDDSRADGLRETLAAELEALKGLEPTDWAALAGRLGALEAQSADWPMVGQGASADASVELPPDAGGQSDEAGWWSGVRRSLSGLVRVTPRAAAPLAPVAVESIRERVRLHLAAAQVAATRREAEAMAPHLSALRDLLDAHFDAEADAVQQARETIEEAAETRPADWPELGAALAEIERQLDGS